MIQCTECEHFVRGPDGQFSLACDPFSTIKEAKCLIKWQLIKLDLMVRAYQATAEMYRKFAPLQERIFKQMQREMDDLDEAEEWKRDVGDDSGQ